MTKQSTRYYDDDITGCEGCRHYDAGGIFVLCMHKLSEYKVNGKEDFHTCAHMRQHYGPCGKEMKLRAA